MSRVRMAVRVRWLVLTVTYSLMMNHRYIVNLKPPVYVCSYQSTHLSIHPPTHLSFHPFIFSSTYISSQNHHRYCHTQVYGLETLMMNPPPIFNRSFYFPVRVASEALPDDHYYVRVHYACMRCCVHLCYDPVIYLMHGSTTHDQYFVLVLPIVDVLLSQCTH